MNKIMLKSGKREGEENLYQIKYSFSLNGNYDSAGNTDIT